MGVTYKLKDEVVHFIISQRQGSPLSSCRQLAEAVSAKFGLRLSKSSVHDVLKESGIVTPRGRKPKNKFKIPNEKKKQIQESLSQVKLLAPPVESQSVPVESHPAPIEEHQQVSVIELPLPPSVVGPEPVSAVPEEIKPIFEYEDAGKIFYKAARWDLGIFSEDEIKEGDWNYYLTYAKGIKVVLENDKSFFIDLPLPIERCIREVADGLVNNVKPFVADKIIDKELFEACMEARSGFKIINFTIVGCNNREIVVFDNIVEFNRVFILNNRVFVESSENNFMKRAQMLFFPQTADNNSLIMNVMNFKGFDTITQHENIVTLLIENSYDKKPMVQEAAEKLNGMYLRDESDRSVKVKIQAA